MKCYEVDACPITGEWIGDKRFTENADRDEWNSRIDTDDYHYDVSESEDGSVIGIRLKWVHEELDILKKLQNADNLNALIDAMGAWEKENKLPPMSYDEAMHEYMHILEVYKLAVELHDKLENV